MRIHLKHIWQRILRLLRLSPLSLAKKCQLAFGLAVALTVALALVLPYVWMSQLTRKAYLDAERARAETLMYQNHFKLKATGRSPILSVLPGQTALAPLDNTGLAHDSNDSKICWIPLKGTIKPGEAKPDAALSQRQKKLLDSLRAQEDRIDSISFEKSSDPNRPGLHSNYVRIFRATDNCISCHNPQGLAGAFMQNEPIGAVIVERPVGDLGKTILLNLVWIGVAGLIAGTGAIVAFYAIIQRVIFRPVRQLRAIANNVAEGNLDIRSTINTGDEYEKLAEAFNHMLDRLQATQDKLRQANKQLDDKIAELSERNIELFKANKLKSEFLANVSHEFRTPLNTILGFTQVLREKPRLLNTDKGQKYAENIITSGNRLLNMINDLLELAKTRAGKIQLHIETISITELVQKVIASFSLLTKKKKIKVKLTVDDGLPAVTTDAGKVQQILYNFLSNAVKFTPEQGRIEIRTSSLPFLASAPVAEAAPATGAGANGSESRFVRIAVSDTGCGIAERDREEIFEKFRQIDGSITRESAGSGLGLAISKELADMLAGSIGLESEPGKGSTFWLDIPVTLTKETENNPM